MYKIAQLILTPGQRSNLVSDIYLAQPDAEKEALAGKLFILAEFKGDKGENAKILDFIFQNLPNAYYQNEKLYLLEKLTSLRIEHIFESSLSKFNQLWSAFLETEKIDFDPSTFTVMAGILHNDEIVFTVRGGARAFLIYPDRTEAKPGKFKLIDIAKDARTDEVTEPNKLFLSVFSGKLPANSFFMAANETLPEYLTHRQITDIITTLPPSSAAEQMKQVLSQVNAYVSFLGVIVKNAARDDFATALPAAPRLAYTENRDSIAGLKATEDATERLLAPSGLVKANKISGWFAGVFARRSAAKVSPGPGFSLIAKASRQKRLLAQLGAKIWLFFRIVASAFINLSGYLFRSLVRRDGRQAVVVDLRAGIAGRLGWFKRLSWKNRLLIAIAMASLAVLAFNLIYLKTKKEQAAAVDSYNELTRLIEQKQDQIESNMVYRNDENALKLYEEIQGLLVDLPQDTEEERSRYESLEARLEEQAEKFRKVERPATKLVADLSSANSQARPDRMFRPDGQPAVFLADNTLKTVFRADLATGEVEAITAVGTTSVDFRTAVVGGQKIYFVAPAGLLAFDTDKRSFTATAFKPPAAIVDLAWYNDRVYSLLGDGRIFRHNAAGTGFAAGTAWLNGEPAVKDAVSLDIDSQVFVGAASGSVVRYQNGRPVDLKLSPVEPALTSLDRIVARPEAKYLYVLDRAGSRLLVFEKSGLFLVQYRSDDLPEWQDVVIDEAAKTIYGLSGQKVFSFKGSHWGP